MKNRGSEYKLKHNSKKLEKHEKGRRKKKGKRSISHRYDQLPLLRSRPGGVHQELVVWDLPWPAKVQLFYFPARGTVQISLSIFGAQIFRTMNKTITSIATRLGLIAAAISIGYNLVAYIVDLTLMTNVWFGIILWVVTIGLMVASAIQAKKALGGFIEFRDAFGAFMITYLLHAALSTLFVIILFNVVDTDAAARLNEITIEASVGMMEKFGAPEEAIDQSIEQLESTNTFGVWPQVRGFLTGIIVYAVIGLIVAAIVKKKPIYTDDSLDSEV